MNPLNGLTVQVSIDGISLSCAPQSGEVFLPDTIGEYNRISNINRRSERDKHGKNRDRRCENYDWRFVYEHQVSRNLLIACTKRIPKKNYIPPLYIRFLSSYAHPLRFHEVRDTLAALKNTHGIDFNVTKVDLAIDLIHSRKINLHSRVSRAINPMKKRDVKLIPGTTTLIMGAHGSSQRFKVYDKGQQLIDMKKIAIQGDISRIEITFRPRVLNVGVCSIDDLCRKGWASPLYGTYFSLDHPLPPLKSLVGIDRSSRPIWELKETLVEKLGKLPDNFYRDYVREHSRFGPAVRKALASFKWD